MRQVSNDTVKTLLRCLPRILAHVQVDSRDTRTQNAVRLVQIILRKLKKFEDDTRK